MEKHIQRVAFELSNLCNYSNMHKKCPVSMYQGKCILDSKVFYKVVDELADLQYEHEIAFHRYNEPLIDPRLFTFIAYVNNKLPKARIFILTNGYYLTQEILNEFEKYDIGEIMVSSYSKDEHKRLSDLRTFIPYTVVFRTLDDRGDIYTREEINCKNPCYATIRDITIDCNANLSICCLDWRSMFTFGNLKDSCLKDILNGENFRKVHMELGRGIRNLEICKRCDWSR
jgi:2-deoxy-scyllo-inosamine dehydrogenase (SAM-dependent)